MKFKPVQHIYNEAGQKAVLLLHSFTSNAREMRNLANMLYEEGYTVYAPNLDGHGYTPERLFASSMAAVWQSAKLAFEELVQKGYKEIYVIGQSLGGVLGIQLANEYPQCKALCILSSPVIERSIDGLEKHMHYFSKKYLQSIGSSEEELNIFLSNHFPRPAEKLQALQQFIVTSGSQLEQITQPVFAAKGALDDAIFQDSIDRIANSVASTHIVKKRYEHSSHLITLGKEKELLAEDIRAFLKSI